MIQPIGFIKRTTIIIYDALLLVGVVMVCYTLLYGIASLLLPDSAQSSLLGKACKIIYLLLAPFLFYGWFWTHGGQTLGMKAWHVYLVNQDGKFINWKTAFIRYCSAILSWACFGLGFTWILVDKRNLAWHDRLSGTQIIRSKQNPK